MESANQNHIQLLASCTGEREVFEHLNKFKKKKRLATGVVCHPDTERNRLYKIPWPNFELNRGPTAPQVRLYQCATLALALSTNGDVSVKLQMETFVTLSILLMFSIIL